MTRARRAPIPRWHRPARLAAALFGAALLALAVRTFVAVPRSVPTESMMPTLLPGEVFLALRWPYGTLAGRSVDRLPPRGEIVLIATSRGEVVKRVIGLPGDRIALRHGTVILDGAPIYRFRVADYLVPESAASRCPGARERQPGGGTRCRIRRFREMLPDGRSWDALDRGDGAGDDIAPITVPAGHLFLLGDNRDRSGDSRFAPNVGGLGLVPVTALRGRARMILWSRRKDDAVLDPVRWWQSLRRERIGRSLSGR